MEYKILTNTDNNVLEQIVKQHLDNGWELQGGVAVAVMNNNNDGYAQAVIKQ